MRPHEPSRFGFSSQGSPLDAVLVEGIRVAFAEPGDNISPLSAARAAAQLLELAPERPRSWFLAGFAAMPGAARDRDDCPEGFLDQYVAGLLAGAVDRGEDDWLFAVVESFGDAVGRVIADEVEPGVIAPTLVTLVLVDHESASALAHLAPASFTRIDEVIEAFRVQALLLERADDLEAAERVRSAIARFEAPR